MVRISVVSSGIRLAVTFGEALSPRNYGTWIVTSDYLKKDDLLMCLRSRLCVISPLSLNG
jgi:hypothetical protein